MRAVRYEASDDDEDFDVNLVPFFSVWQLEP